MSAAAASAPEWGDLLIIQALGEWRRAAGGTSRRPPSARARSLGISDARRIASTRLCASTSSPVTIKGGCGSGGGGVTRGGSGGGRTHRIDLDSVKKSCLTHVYYV